mgnify:CR=1 FL=1
MDIVKRLRKQKWQVFDEMRGLIPDTTAYEAADEIERLREALRTIADHEVAEYPTTDTLADFARSALQQKDNE